MAPGVVAKGDGNTSSSEDVPNNWRPLQPNILITGTPGVGKTTLAREVATELGLQHIEVGAFARERNLFADHDDEREAYFMHEDAVLDELEPIMANGGVILEHHSCDWYPERWIQMVFVLRCATETLYDRLEARRYPRQKLQENMEAEIMQVILDEAARSYPRVELVELQSNTSEDKVRNIRCIKQKWGTLNEPEQT